jgi:alpha-beta hydrolase superfamily lysophospholipase
VVETQIRHETGDFEAPGAVRLVWQSWAPDGHAAAVLAVVHGYGEHGGRYGFLVDDMVPRGYTVFTFDLRGHGRSPGRRGHIDRFGDYLADTRAFLAQVRRACPNTPVVLLGHSMGGLIAAALAEEDDAGLAQERDAGLAGVVLSSPFLGLRLAVPALQIKTARLLSRVAPTLRMPNPLRAEQLSHDPAVVAAAGADPLNHRRTTARWGVEILNAQPAVIAAAGRLRTALLLLYAADDPIADPRAAERFFERAGSADKAKRCYAGYYHEIFNEVGRAAVFGDLAAWLGGHVPVRQTAANQAPAL